MVVMIKAFKPGACAKAYDFVVLGAGSGGSAAATTLARRFPNATVALFEAGGDWRGNQFVRMPGLASFSRLLRNTPPLRALRWHYDTEPQEFLTNRVLRVTRGRGLGGESLVSDAAYFRGNSIDYEGWSKSAAWAPSAITAAFRELRESKLLWIERPAGNAIGNPLNNAFVNCCDGLALQPVESLNVELRQPQAGVTQQLTHKGRRLDAFTAFHRPIADEGSLTMPTNLHVFTGALADTLQFTPGASPKVTGVRIQRCGGGRESDHH
jgi:choline dehydrogenase-like flavoprotein